jgi:hypothetical protein
MSSLALAPMATHKEGTVTKKLQYGRAGRINTINAKSWLLTECSQNANM